MIDIDAEEVKDLIEMYGSPPATEEAIQGWVDHFSDIATIQEWMTVGIADPLEAAFFDQNAVNAERFIDFRNYLKEVLELELDEYSSVSVLRALYMWANGDEVVEIIDVLLQGVK